MTPHDTADHTPRIRPDASFANGRTSRPTAGEHTVHVAEIPQ